MKALIFNSGIGKRLGDFTKQHPKCFLKLGSGETILQRQIRILSDYGIKDFIITTGPFKEQVENIKNLFPKLNFTFVQNVKYSETNYIYSFYLCKDLIKNSNDDFLILHGDLVFDSFFVHNFLKFTDEFSYGTYSKKENLPPKDFKAKIKNGNILEISINIFGKDCYCFQPFYKFRKEDLNKWLDVIEHYVKENKVNVYAENALNEILNKITLKAYNYDDSFINEIDNLDDYNRVNNDIFLYDLKNQKQSFDLNDLREFINKEHLRKMFVIKEKFVSEEKAKQILGDGVLCDYFDDFTPNPDYQEIQNGLAYFLKKEYDAIIAIGGGTAIDISKGIKYFKEKELNNSQYLTKKIYSIVIPTIFGTGSESTRFFVMYKDHIKNSIQSDGLLPDFVYFNPEFNLTVPVLQRKSAFLDALCHGIETYLNKNSNNESLKYAMDGLKILANIDFNALDDAQNKPQKMIKQMILSMNLCGKAICLTKTSIAHAFSYGLTSEFNMPHGMAAFLCLYAVLNYKSVITNSIVVDLVNLKLKTYSFSKEFKTLDTLIFYINNLFESIKYIYKDYKELDDKTIDELVKKINVQRLNNFPIILESKDLKNIFRVVSVSLKSI